MMDLCFAKHSTIPQEDDSQMLDPSVLDVLLGTQASETCKLISSN
jgi:hypothetical protein